MENDDVVTSNVFSDDDADQSTEVDSDEEVDAVFNKDVLLRIASPIIRMSKSGVDIFNICRRQSSYWSRGTLHCETVRRKAGHQIRYPRGERRPVGLIYAGPETEESKIWNDIDCCPPGGTMSSWPSRKSSAERKREAITLDRPVFGLDTDAVVLKCIFKSCEYC